ncbi:MAG: M48 family metalloprotease [Crocinitomicaceae bacterium]|nr:M48 family metalloprotease [Crocinitomicaceae bacterium]
MRISLFLGILSLFLLTGCGSSSNGGGQGINLFTIQQDKEFGEQVANEIASDPTTYPILDSVRYSSVYQYIYKVRNKILNSGNVAHKDDFGWRVQVIHDDSTVNAFCTPGGYIYVYTGILKFLESEDQLAGVLGHEIGHADMRHSTRQMTTMYGIQTLLDVLAGNRELIKTVTAGLIGLKFSRNHESEADERSVHYLCNTDYNADGGAGFFEKIQQQGGSKIPQFLNTHPNPENRIENFHNQKNNKGCTGRNSYIAEYQAMQKKLP